MVVERFGELGAFCDLIRVGRFGFGFGHLFVERVEGEVDFSFFELVFVFEVAFESGEVEIFVGDAGQFELFEEGSLFDFAEVIFRFGED